MSDMTKQEAQRLVQEKLALIRDLLHDVEVLCDQHRFTCDLPTSPSYYQLTYLPKNLTDAERGRYYGCGELHWAGIGENYNGGEWVSSSNFGDC